MSNEGFPKFHEKIISARDADEPEDIRQQRSDIEQKIRTDESGVDRKRMSHFLEKRELPASDIKFIHEEEVQTLDSIFGNQSLSKSNGGAVYVRNLGICFVFRDRFEASVDRTFASELAGIHELGHASHSFTDFYERDLRITMQESELSNPVVFPAKNIVSLPRCGFSLALPNKKIRGNFLEEGFAELVANEYAEENMTPVFEAGIIDGFFKILPKEKLLELEDGVAKQHMQYPLTIDAGIYGHTGQEFTSKISHFRPTKRGIGLSPSSLPAAAFDHLIDAVPNFKTHLYEARKSVEGLREVAQDIESLDKGLYEYLMALKYNKDDFMKGYQAVKKAVESRSS